MKELQKYFLSLPSTPCCLVSRKFWHPCLSSGQTKEGETNNIQTLATFDFFFY